MDEFLLVLGAVFVGEIGDKTMLVCLWLVTVYAVRPVLIGVIPACFAVPLIGILMGVVFKTYFPETIIRLGGAALFLYLCYWSIREAQESDDFEKKPSRFGVIVDSFVVFFIAEMADRTQFITVVATTQGGDWVADWLGSAVGLVLANLVAIALYQFAGRNIPRRYVMYVAAVLFLASGVWLLFYVGGVTQPTAWTIGAMVVVLFNPVTVYWARMLK